MASGKVQTFEVVTTSDAKVRAYKCGRIAHLYYQDTSSHTYDGWGTFNFCKLPQELWPIDWVFFPINLQSNNHQLVNNGVPTCSINPADGTVAYSQRGNNITCTVREFGVTYVTKY